MGNSIARALSKRLPPEQASAVSEALRDPELPGTWEEAEAAGMVEEWEYIAAVDACEMCTRLNGKRFRGLAELYEVLPDVGPNPKCLNGSACGCRALPCFRE